MLAQLETHRYTIKEFCTHNKKDRGRKNNKIKILREFFIKQPEFLEFFLDFEKNNKKESFELSF